MEAIKISKNKIRFIIDNEYSSQYNMTVKDIKECYPYPERVLDSILLVAKERYNNISFGDPLYCEISSVNDNTIFMDIPVKQSFLGRIKNKLFKNR